MANQLVESLAAQLLDAASGREVSIHQRGPKDCPFYFNPDRELQYITGRRTFDEQCRKKLPDKLPKELDPAATLAAFESLLTAFDE